MLNKNDSEIREVRVTLNMCTLNIVSSLSSELFFGRFKLLLADDDTQAILMIIFIEVQKEI